MPFETDWLNSEKKIMQIGLAKTFTWEDHDQAIREVSTDIATVKHTVHLIIDARQTTMPRGNPFPHLRFMVQTLPANTGLVINVGADRSERTILNAFIGVAHKVGAQKLHVVDTMDEAMQLIKQAQAHSR